MAEVIKAESGTEPVSNPIAIIPFSRYEELDGWDRGDYIEITRSFNTGVYRIVDFYTPTETVTNDDGTETTQEVAAEDQEEDIRMGKDGRARVYDIGDTVDDTFFCSVEEGFYSNYEGLGTAKLDWKIINDTHACRANSEFLQENDVSVGDRISIISNDTYESAIYEIYDTFSDGIDEPYIRMGKSARDRIGMGETRTSRITGAYKSGRWSWLIRSTPIDSPNISDTHACQLSEKAYDLLGFGSFYRPPNNVNVDEWFTVETNGEVGHYGVVKEDEYEIVRPVIRLGEVGRRQLGGFSTPKILDNSEVSLFDSTLDIARTNENGTAIAVPKPKIKQSFASWEEEIGNPLLTRISNNLANRLGVEAGDMVKITSDIGGNQERSAVYRMSQRHSTDIGLEVPRMGYWARQRLIHSGKGEEQPGRFHINKVETFQEPQNRKYVGVSQSQSEWDWGSNEERIAISPDLASEWSVEPKRTGPETDSNSTQNDTWSNILLEHAEFSDRLAAYTFYITHDLDPNYSVLRTPYLGRERLNDTNRDTETDGVPNLFAVKLHRNVGTTNIHSTDEAGDTGRYYEDAVNSANDRVIFTAPHAGPMEFNTGQEARLAADKINADYWTGSGYRRGISGSFERWHITSADVSLTDGYHKLNTFSDDYEIVWSIHGYSNDDLLVGGRIPYEDRVRVVEYLKEEIGETPIVIRAALPDEEQDSEAFDGDALDHYSARMCKNGPNGKNGVIQLEQPSEIRRDHWRDVATAMAKFTHDYLDMS